MSSNIERFGKFKTLTVGNIDYWYGGGGIAYPNRTIALQTVKGNMRKGRTIGIIENDEIVEYIWHNGITDNDLVLKQSLSKQSLVDAGSGIIKFNSDTGKFDTVDGHPITGVNLIDNKKITLTYTNDENDSDTDDNGTIELDISSITNDTVHEVELTTNSQLKLTSITGEEKLVDLVSLYNRFTNENLLISLNLNDYNKLNNHIGINSKDGSLQRKFVIDNLVKNHDVNGVSIDDNGRITMDKTNQHIINHDGNLINQIPLNLFTTDFIEKLNSLYGGKQLVLSINYTSNNAKEITFIDGDIGKEQIIPLKTDGVNEIITFDFTKFNYTDNPLFKFKIFDNGSLIINDIKIEEGTVSTINKKIDYNYYHKISGINLIKNVVGNVATSIEVYNNANYIMVFTDDVIQKNTLPKITINGGSNLEIPLQTNETDKFICYVDSDTNTTIIKLKNILFDSVNGPIAGLNNVTITVDGINNYDIDLLALKSFQRPLIVHNPYYDEINGSTETAITNFNQALTNYQNSVTIALNTKANAVDVYTKDETDLKLDNKADSDDVYNKDEVDTKLGTKANADDVYNKTEVDTKLDSKADSDDVYNKDEVDTKLGTKANADDVYNKTEVDTIKNELQNNIDEKADTEAVQNLIDNSKNIASLSVTGTNNKKVTITMTDGTKFEASFVDIQGTGGDVVDTQINEAEFDSTNGVLTLTTTDDNTVTVTLDGRYALIANTYTKTEVDTKLSGKAASNHNHDSAYYTKTEVDTKLSGKAASNHNHDGAYYTKTEVDTKVNEKIDKELAFKSGNHHIYDGFYIYKNIKSFNFPPVPENLKDKVVFKALVKDAEGGNFKFNDTNLPAINGADDELKWYYFNVPGSAVKTKEDNVISFDGHADGIKIYDLIIDYNYDSIVDSNITLKDSNNTIKFTGKSIKFDSNDFIINSQGLIKNVNKYDVFKYHYSVNDNTWYRLVKFKNKSSFLIHVQTSKSSNYTNATFLVAYNYGRTNITQLSYGNYDGGLGFDKVAIYKNGNVYQYAHFFVHIKGADYVEFSVQGFGLQNQVQPELDFGGFLDGYTKIAEITDLTKGLQSTNVDYLVKKHSNTLEGFEADGVTILAGKNNELNFKSGGNNNVLYFGYRQILSGNIDKLATKVAPWYHHNGTGFVPYWHKSNDGAGSGLDADLLDGKQGLDYLDKTMTISQTIKGVVKCHSTNRAAGMYGEYDSHKIGHIWSIGDNYKIHKDGADFGNIYGLAYKHVNNSTGGNMAGRHQAVWCNNGYPRAAMGYDGMWVKTAYAFGNNKKITNDDTHIYYDGKKLVFDDSPLFQKKIKIKGTKAWVEFFNASNNSSKGDIAVGIIGDNFTIFEPEDSDKVMFQVKDDDAAYVFGVKVLTENTGIRKNYSSNQILTGTLTAPNFILSSDERLKENIVDFESDFPRIKLNLKRYNYKSDETKTPYIGVIAQDLEESGLGEFVEQDENGMKSVKYIQLLLAKNHELEQRIDQLEKIIKQKFS